MLEHALPLLSEPQQGTPTQANTRLEWATRPPVRALLGLDGRGRPSPRGLCGSRLFCIWWVLAGEGAPVPHMHGRGCPCHFPGRAYLLDLIFGFAR